MATVILLTFIHKIRSLPTSVLFLFPYSHASIELANIIILVKQGCDMINDVLDY